MKIIFIFLTLISLALSADIPKIDIYIESLCPYSINFITGSFKSFYANPDKNKLANISITAFGNAEQSWDGTKWVFRCQHGARECYCNTIIICAQKHLEIPTANNFIICLLENVKANERDFDAAVKACLSTEMLKEMLNCAGSDEGNRLLHEAGLRTPKHDYVPWLVFNGKHDENIQNRLEVDMLGFLCKGMSDLNGC
jgi:hypothetical protein